MTISPGARLGPYEVGGQLGVGGMGEVYRARDTSLDRDVAIKVLPEAFASDPERLSRFEREAKLLASLNHPNIAAIYGLETSGHERALILELVEGQTLQDRIGQGAIPLDEALPIAKQIAEALEAAHEQGIIHRDLKPANIKVTSDGVVKVLDFGLAKALDEVRSAGPSGPATDDAANSPTMSTAAATQAGFILGTAAYMSPEQARGQVVDRRADIWAYGVVLLEMLTGASAFTGKTVSDTLAYVLTKEPDWDALPSTTPSSIRRLLRRCLEKDPKRRLGFIGDARLEIEDAGAEPDRAATTGAAVDRRMVWQRPVGIAAIALAALVAGLVVSTAMRPEAGPDPVMRFALVPSAEAPMSVLLGPRDLAISPDGSFVVYDGVPPGSSVPRLNLWPLSEGSSTPLRGADRAMGPFVSPGGEWIGFVSQANPRVLRKISVLGGQPVTITEALDVPLGVSWGRDDAIVFGTAVTGLFRVSSDGGDPEPLTTLDPVAGETSHSWPFVIPGRGAVLFVISDGPTLSTGQLAVVDVATGSVTRLGVAGVGPYYVPTGHLVYAADDRSLRAVPFDVATLEITGTPVTLLDDLVVKPDGTADFAIADTGHMVYAVGTGGTGSSRQLAWRYRDGRRAEPLFDLVPGGYRSVALSPDGGMIAFERWDPPSDIWTYDLARGTINRLTDGAAGRGLSFAPLWTPDGRQIVFGSTSEEEASGRLVLVNADGTGEVEVLASFQDGAVVTPSSWSPDGASLVFQLDTDPQTRGGSDIGVVSMDGERVIEMLFESEYAEHDPSVSPDGNWIAYVSNRSGRIDVYIERFPELGDRVVVSTAGGDRPIWSRDGRELLYLSIDDSQLFAVRVDTDGALDVGSPEIVAEAPFYSMEGRRTFEPAPDGERFLMINRGNTFSDGAEADATGEPPRINVVLNWIEELKARVPVQ